MVVSEPRECWLPNNLFRIVYAVVLAVVAAAVLYGYADQGINAGPILIMLVFGLVGGLVPLKGISITRCPSKVLLLGTLFIPAVIVLDRLLF